MSAASKLNELFPQPSRTVTLTHQSPTPLAGISRASGEALVETLRMNHEKFHVFFNDKGFHNHLSHHLYVAYAFGGSPSLIREVYEHHAKDQRPSFASPEPITRSNWKKHLGDEKFYNAYLQFFTNELTTGPGLGATLEDFIFSEQSNWRADDVKDSPRMLSRFFGGLLHPLIHTGHIEFGHLGMVAEGLAQTAVTSPGIDVLVPRDFFPSPLNALDSVSKASDTVSSTLNSFLALSVDERSKAKEIIPYTGTHSFELLAQMLKDDRLAAGQACERTSETRFTDTLKNRGEIIRDEYAKKWEVPLEPTQIENKIEELSWLATLIFGLGGWREGHKFRADFFTLHLLTSSLFLPTVAAHLPLAYQSALLRAHLSSMLGYWVSRGRPELPIKAYFANTTSSPVPPTQVIEKPHDAALGKNCLFENPWLAIIESSLHFPEEHLVKGQRALVHYGSLYGTRKAGKVLPPGVQVSLPGIDVLDGSLFIRVAGQFLDGMGWAREGQEPGSYDRQGLGWDEVWESK